MTTERWQKVERIFREALERAPTERTVFLDEACGDDEELRSEAESLLASDSAASDFLDAPPITMEQIADPDEVAMRMVGQRIGQYHVHGLIAVGGMGAVYEAVQEKPHRTVALKVIRRGIASRSAMRRFQYEVQVMGRLRHPGIAQIYDAGMHNGDDGVVPYFAMEYIPAAKNILEFAQARQLGTRERLQLFAQVCDAIQHGHQKGIIHRDLKPANILVDSAGQPKVIDFGVARATDADLAVTTLQTNIGQLIGTVQYMSPEQCDADPHDLDVRSDVYSLGVVLYELLTGKLPYSASSTNIIQATQAVREQMPRRLSSMNSKLRGDVETVVLRALEKDRERRYQSAAELAGDIRHYLNGEAILARPPTMLYLLRLFSRRHRAGFAALAVTAMALLLATVVSLWFAFESERQRERAEQGSYALNLASAQAAIQRNDVSAAETRIQAAAVYELSQGGESWELQHLRNQLDRSLSSVRAYEGEALRVAVNPQGDLVASIGRNDDRSIFRMWPVHWTGGVPVLSSAYVFSLAAKPEEDFVSAVFGPDGSWIALGMSKGSIELWGVSEPADPRPLMTLEDRPSGVTALAIQPPSGTVLASACGTSITLWDVSLGAPLGVLRGHTRQVDALAFSLDGKLLASASKDATVRIWDMTGQEGKLVAILRGHADHVREVAFSDHGTLASGSLDGTVKLWDIEGSKQQYAARTDDSVGVELDTLHSDEEGVTCVAFQPGGLLLASGSLDRTIRLWELEEERSVWNLPALDRAWQVTDRHLLATLRGHSQFVQTLAFEPKGRWLVSGSSDGTLRLWAAGKAPEVPTLLGHTSSVTSIAFHPRGQWLASGGGNNSIRIWDVLRCEGVLSSHAHGSPVLDIAFSSGGRYFASVSNGGTVKLWTYQHEGDAIAPKLEAIYTDASAGQGCAAVAFSEDEKRLVTASVGGYVRVLDISNPHSPSKVFERSPDGISLEAVVFLDRSGHVLAAGGNRSVTGSSLAGGVRVWEVDSGTRLTDLWEHQQAVTCLAIDHKRKLLASGSLDRSIKLWDIRNPRKVRPVRHLDAGEEVLSVAFDPQGRRLVSGGRHGTTRIWDVATGQELVVLRGHIGDVRDVVFDSQGSRLATASGGKYGTDNSIKLWETEIDAPTIFRRANVNKHHKEAEVIVEDLFQRYVSMGEVLDALAQKNELPPEVIESARRLTRFRGDDPSILWKKSWHVARQPGLTQGSYAASLRRANLALSSSPQSQHRGRYLLAKGTALYRMQRYEEAEAVLENAVRRLPTSHHEPLIPAAITVLAMTFNRLGKLAEARDALTDARIQIEGDPWRSSDDAAVSLFMEAEALIGE